MQNCEVARPASPISCRLRGSSICRRRRSVEGQDGTRDLARLHRAEGLVEVVEAAATGDHLVEQEAALAIEVQIARNVDAEAVAAHAGGLHATFGTDGHPRELD